MLKNGTTIVPLLLISITKASIQAGLDKPPKAFLYNRRILFNGYNVQGLNIKDW
jgi:hypothetical protein